MPSVVRALDAPRSVQPGGISRTRSYNRIPRPKPKNRNVLSPDLGLLRDLKFCLFRTPTNQPVQSGNRPRTPKTPRLSPRLCVSASKRRPPPPRPSRRTITAMTPTLWIVWFVFWAAWAYPFMFRAPHKQRRKSVTARGATLLGLVLELAAYSIAFSCYFPLSIPQHSAYRRIFNIWADRRHPRVDVGNSSGPAVPHHGWAV
jgi:hypothetical protein